MPRSSNTALHSCPPEGFFIYNLRTMHPLLFRCRVLARHQKLFVSAVFFRCGPFCPLFFVVFSNVLVRGEFWADLAVAKTPSFLANSLFFLAVRLGSLSSPNPCLCCFPDFSRQLLSSENIFGRKMQHVFGKLRGDVEIVGHLYQSNSCRQLQLCTGPGSEPRSTFWI